MERALTTHNSESRRSFRFLKTLGTGLVALGLTILLVPTAFILFMAVFEGHFHQDTELLWLYAVALYSLPTYVPAGLVITLLGFLFRQWSHTSSKKL